MPTSSLLKEYVSKGGFYKAVVEDGADIIFVVNYEGEILYHNPSVEENLGHPPLSLIGHNFFDYILPEKVGELKGKFFDCINKPYAESIEFRFRKNDDSYSYLEFNSVNLKHKEGIDGLILDCRDITQRIEDSEELLRAQKTKEQFLANMSHEIRTPINGIAGMITLLSETPISAEQKKYLTAIKNSSDNLKAIINDILDLSVIESGKLKLEKIGFNINYQLTHIVDTFKFQTDEKDVTLSLSIHPSLNTVVLGDPVRLNQILLNLISNAIKFTHEGGIEINAKCEEENDDWITATFNVTDTGIGISEKKLSNIFESFTQADETVTRRFGGTGLGLSISKQLVDLQNGTIKVKSKENIGTTFSFSITYQKGKSEDLVVQRDSIDSEILKNNTSLEQLNVLLVEDNDINRLYAANILKKWKCNYQIAENGLIATEKIKKGNFDIILMDVQMPIMDGIEATKIIRKMTAPINLTPIIALTANVIKGDDEKYKAVGMDDYLSKPFLPADLFDILIKYVKIEQEEKPSINSKDRTLEKITTDKLIDLTYLKTMSSNDVGFIKEMIELFLELTPKSVTDLKHCIATDNWDELRKTAHRAKPTMVFFGLKDLQKILSQLENFETEKIDAPTAKKMIAKIETDFKSISAELEEILLKDSF
ncbi:MAG: ATP-binding protein [Cyclobacteriaceae bacterium]|nr:ATP-binding protein [Cyclobacteriaceae bacterium]